MLQSKYDEKEEQKENIAPSKLSKAEIIDEFISNISDFTSEEIEHAKEMFFLTAQNKFSAKDINFGMPEKDQISIFI